MNSRLAFRSALALAGALATLALVPAANAGVLVASADNCDTQTLSQPFLPWADPASYTLNPGGSFEDGAAGWQLNGAAVTPGNEPFNVGSSADANALSIPLGTAATSAPICVGIEHPDLRFFARATSPSAVLRVEVLFESADGTVNALTIGNVSGTSAWALTAPIPVVANLLPLLPGNHTAVAFRFSAIGGSFRIDDVYVDPYSRN